MSTAPEHRRPKDFTDEDYAAMAHEFETQPIIPAGPVELGPGAFIKLKNGRPAGRKTPAGRTPTTSVRLAPEIRQRLDRQASRESVASGEIIRKAVVEYLDRHEAS